jgi:small-conductance mechanosensitive channel/CRP-like cAMP-binding protein
MQRDRRQLLRRLVAPALASLLFAAIAAAWWRMPLGVPDMAQLAVAQMLAAFFCFALTWLGLRLLDLALWCGLLARRGVPALVVGIVDGVVWLIVAVLVAETIFALPITAVAATSGIAIAIVGFALRDTLASLMSGIAINIERSFHLGDWLDVGPGVAGRVVEIGWLTTRLLTNEQVTVVVPNARLATAPFRNHGSPGTFVREQLEVHLDHALSPARVERVLIAAARSVPAIVAAEREPDVRIGHFGPNGIDWLIRYWVGDAASVPDIRYALQRAVLRHLHQAGIGLPYPKLDLYHAEMPPRVLHYEADLDRLLQRSELFSSLPREELSTIAGKAQRLRINAGAAVVRQGETGHSLFVIMEGVLAVVAARVNGAEHVVEALGPGAMFGEFALLTGEPRSATVRAQSDAVLYEIGKDDLQPILQRRPALADELGRILAERQASLARSKERQLLPPPAIADREAMLLARIRAFFRL